MASLMTVVYVYIADLVCLHEIDQMSCIRQNQRLSQTLRRAFCDIVEAQILCSKSFQLYDDRTLVTDGKYRPE